MHFKYLKCFVLKEISLTHFINQNRSNAIWQQIKYLSLSKKIKSNTWGLVVYLTIVANFIDNHISLLRKESQPTSLNINLKNGENKI